ncbi:unnamed protein product [Rhizophagus irregularis]|uniref:Uncharacterized protein n=1 Tax=Rhizophagus irregularis TaxID=588596 RepID=A0A2I1HD81_9GLOM|nr:hypothetical protein RhiirA4_477432 [Rhizophagus irregularis]CAB4418242.1 unnamed protein product [Rhizophagus irregularis]CAB4418668.1 unnamed protein product [Rhizophagus irregularis]
MEETLKQYITEYYRGFIGFEIEHIEDFYQASKTYKRINLGEYETTVRDILYPPGEIRIGVRDARCIPTRPVQKHFLMDLAIFTMKLGGETVKRILEKILRENPREGAANEKMNNELDSLKKRSLEDSEKIEELKKEIKQAEERIKFLENEAISQRRK